MSIHVQTRAAAIRRRREIIANVMRHAEHAATVQVIREMLLLLDPDERRTQLLILLHEHAPELFAALDRPGDPDAGECAEAAPTPTEPKQGCEAGPAPEVRR